jgi:hypothetical protein
VLGEIVAALVVMLDGEAGEQDSEDFDVGTADETTEESS